MSYGNGGTNVLGGASYGAVQTPPAPMETVGSAIDIQQKQLAELHACIDNLSERLVSVLGPEPPSTQGGAAGVSPMPVNVVQRIRDNGSGIQMAANRIAYLLSRLQL